MIRHNRLICSTSSTVLVIPLTRPVEPTTIERKRARLIATWVCSTYLRDHGYAIRVPPSLRDPYASGQKLLREGLSPQAVPEHLGITFERWREIQDACSFMVIALQSGN